MNKNKSIVYFVTISHLYEKVFRFYLSKDNSEVLLMIDALEIT